jgi:hypothetical protein
LLSILFNFLYIFISSFIFSQFKYTRLSLEFVDELIYSFIFRVRRRINILFVYGRERGEMVRERNTYRLTYLTYFKYELIYLSFIWGGKWFKKEKFLGKMNQSETETLPLKSLKSIVMNYY